MCVRRISVATHVVGRWVQWSRRRTWSDVVWQRHGSEWQRQLFHVNSQLAAVRSRGFMHRTHSGHAHIDISSYSQNLCICMQICNIYIYIYIYIYMYMIICAGACPCADLCVYVHMYIYIYMYTCVYKFCFLCVGNRIISIYIYIDMHIHVYMEHVAPHVVGPWWRRCGCFRLDALACHPMAHRWASCGALSRPVAGVAVALLWFNQAVTQQLRLLWPRQNDAHTQAATNVFLCYLG